LREAYDYGDVVATDQALRVLNAYMELTLQQESGAPANENQDDDESSTSENGLQSEDVVAVTPVPFHVSLTMESSFCINDSAFARGLRL
jgi:hypothetical protein